MQKPRKMKSRPGNRTQSGQERSVPAVGLTTDSTDNTDVQCLLTRIVARTAHIRATISV